MQFYIYRSPRGGGTDYLRNALNFRKGMSAPASWMAPIEVSWIRQPRVPTLELAFSVTSGIYIDVVERNLTDLGLSVVSDKPLAFKDRTLPADLMTSTSSNSELDTKLLSLVGNYTESAILTVQEDDRNLVGLPSVEMAISNLHYVKPVSNVGAGPVSDSFLPINGSQAVASVYSNSVLNNDSRYVAAKAIDGNTNTVWIANTNWLAAGAYIEFTLNTMRTLSGVNNYYNSARAIKTALVEVKVDGVWITDGTLNFPSSSTNVLLSKTYLNPQAIRITPKTNWGDTYVNIAELKFLGVI